MEEKFNLWLILDITIRIFAVIALVPIIAKYYQNIWLTILIGLFILWAFRPIWLNFKRFFPNKSKNNSVDLPFVRGDKISSITTLDKFKEIMKDLIRGYPKYLNWGIFETYFGESTSSVIKFLEEDGIIKTFKPKKDGDPVLYRVTSQGILFASAMAQLEYSEKMKKMTLALIILGGLALVLNLIYLLSTLI
jgi:hypothetical protein